MAPQHTHTLNTHPPSTCHSDAHANNSLILKKMPVRLALFSKALFSKALRSNAKGSREQNLNNIFNTTDSK